MLFRFLVTVLLSLHAAERLRDSQNPQKWALTVASPGETVMLECHTPEGRHSSWMIRWYKEERDRSWQWIYPFSSKYSRAESKPAGSWNLSIPHAQREDSGVYYCTELVRLKFIILSGTRLIISDAPSPALSVFLPSSLETSRPNRSLPVLCLLFNAPPSRDALSWEIGGETSQEDGKGVSVVDGEGVLSTWSLTLVPPERWKPGVSYACSDQGKRNVTAAFPANPTSRGGNCIPVLNVGVPCVFVLLLVPLLVLLFRKRLLGGKAQKPANEIPMGQIQQTEYAELHCNQ